MSDILDGVLNRMAIETDRSYQRSDFEGRLRIQKTVYLLKALGYTKLSQYRFNLYIRGPYSPGLARDYYAWSQGESTASPIHIPARYLRPAAEAVKIGIPFLEVLTTLHFIAEGNWRQSKRELFTQVRWAKSRWPAEKLEKYLGEAWEFLVGNSLLQEHT